LDFFAAGFAGFARAGLLAFVFAFLAAGFFADVRFVAGAFFALIGFATASTTGAGGVLGVLSTFAGVDDVEAGGGGGGIDLISGVVFTTGFVVSLRAFLRARSGAYA
jgi:hypothetical protein